MTFQNAGSDRKEIVVLRSGEGQLKAQGNRNIIFEIIRKAGQVKIWNNRV